MPVIFLSSTAGKLIDGHTTIVRTSGPNPKSMRQGRARAQVGDEELLAEIAGWVRRARHAVALTGAGISTESGIPDFRGPDGVWRKDPAAERMSHLGPYMRDP